MGVAVRFHLPVNSPVYLVMSKGPKVTEEPTKLWTLRTCNSHLMFNCFSRFRRYQSCDPSYTITQTRSGLLKGEEYEYIFIINLSKLNSKSSVSVVKVHGTFQFIVHKNCQTVLKLIKTTIKYQHL